MRKRIITALTATAVVAGAAAAGAESSTSRTSTASSTSAAPTVTPELDAVAQVAPGLAHYRDLTLAQGLWQRDGLSVRDRSLVTVAHLITAGQTEGLRAHVDLALDSGLTPREISEAITHLAFYTGWQNAADAAVVVERVFDARGVSAADLPAAQPDLLPIDEAAEAARAQQVESDFGEFFPGVVASTGQVLFQDLWLRPDLAPRDRSLITVVALVTSGQVQQINFHLGRALDSGLTVPEAGETLHHLAYYAGWPKVFTAMPVVRDVLASRTN